MITIVRGYGLTEQLKALKVNETSIIFSKDYSINVVYATIGKLNKKGPYKFRTSRKKKRNEELDRITVKRIE